MSEFDKVIGYESIKAELIKICDTLKNPAKYEKLGVKMTKNLFLYGAPGLGKTLISQCFIKESGRSSYICRKNKPDGEFVRYIGEVFETAKNNQPSIILIDDLDKFANEDDNHKDAEAYVTLQSCIDEIKDLDVFVVATANNVYKLPGSLIRAGRFDKQIEIMPPEGKEAEEIIKYFLSTKKCVENVNYSTLAKLLYGCSCAEVENIINQAGVDAAFNDKISIDMMDIVNASISSIYNAPGTIQDEAQEDIEYISYHEAGHALVGELLEPHSVTAISIGNSTTKPGGFTSYYKNLNIGILWH